MIWKHQISNPNNIKFKIDKFDDSKYNGSYPRFSILYNENGEIHLISDDVKQLYGFVGWMNRISKFPI